MQKLQPFQSGHFGSRFKIPKTCEKQLYKHNTVVLQKNPLQKNTKHSRNETVLKIGHLAKAKAHAKWSVWVKNQKCKKHAKNCSTRTLELFCAKKLLEKTPIIREMRRGFENRPSCKGYSACNGYSPCKMVSFAQKLKMPKTCDKQFYKNIKVVL